MAATLRGTILTPRGPTWGEIAFGARIEEIRPLEPPEGRPGVRTLARASPFILPGFIDTHVHGGGGGDTMDGADGVRTLAAFHLRHGTTTLFPTTITNPWERVLEALHGVLEVMHDGDPELPSIPGAHLEGPFISPERLGAQPPHTLEPTAEHLDQLLRLRAVRLVTLAPEIPGALDAARRFARAGVRVSVGHTNATFEQVRELTRVVQTSGGTVGFTHLFNAMGGLSARQPGAVGAALADPHSFVELILDGHHVHEGSFLAALASKPLHLHLVTDAIRACGLPPGESELGGRQVIVEGGVAKLPDGTLAGSVLTLDQALRNAVAAGLSLSRASSLLSNVPARYLDFDDRGRLEPGKRADLVVLDDELEVEAVYLAGRQVVQR